MNVTKNGIPRHAKPSQQFGKPYRATPNPHKRFVTFYRKEDDTPVWLITPMIGKEVNQLKREGWSVIEVWDRK